MVTMHLVDNQCRFFTGGGCGGRGAKCVAADLCSSYQRGRGPVTLEHRNWDYSVFVFHAVL